MEDATKIGEVLGLDARSARRRRWGPWVVGLALALAAAVGIALYRRQPERPAILYDVEPARRGDLTVTVTATGQLEALHQVEVGTEVSGTVAKVLGDYNQRVTRGQVLVELDTSRMEAQILQSEAAVKSAQAALLDAQVSEKDSSRQLGRLEALFEMSGGKQPSRAELDAARTARDRAGATKAAAQARLAEARAQLSIARTTLEKATVRSPIDGIVLERKVEPGQTVAASLQTPVLFLIAESLSQMELHVAVDEADVGQVREGQRATFTVDAYPARSFPATITQVRFSPQPVEGVVTYETILSVENDDLSLRPGMTATAEITVAEREDVLLTPNAGLRFAPPTAAAEEQESPSIMSRLFRRSPRLKPGRSARDPRSPEQRVHVLDGDAPRQVDVTVGLSDGRHTEVLKGPLADGDPVIVDMESRGER